DGRWSYAGRGLGRQGAPRRRIGEAWSASSTKALETMVKQQLGQAETSPHQDGMFAESWTGRLTARFLSVARTPRRLAAAPTRPPSSRSTATQRSTPSTTPTRTPPLATFGTPPRHTSRRVGGGRSGRRIRQPSARAATTA